jgi:hypothetical protein
MKNKNPTDALNDLLLIQEIKYDHDLNLLKNQFDVAYESVKPLNLIKNLVHNVTASAEIKNDLLSNIISFGAGFLSKNILLGSLHNPVTKLLGTIFEFGVANAVSKNTDRIKTISGNLFKHFFKRNQIKPDLRSEFTTREQKA